MKMDRKNRTPFMEKRRGATDKSLVMERGKTDQSLANLRDKTAMATDEAIAADRAGADLERKADHGHGHSPAQKRQITETVEGERILMDAAIQKERDANSSLEEELLSRERGETDRNLSSERSDTDSEVSNASDRLTSERTSHLATKAQLTTRDEFRAIVSHDLRNPLGVILSCVSMLIEDPTFAGRPTETKYWHEMIKRNAELALRLITDILDMELVDEGQLKLRVGTYGIDELVREVVEGFAHASSAKTILLKAAPSNISTPLVCDHDRFVQVLGNLIGNALKFTPENGSITVTVEENEVETTFSVIDTGPGIETSSQEKIFMRYAQLENKDRRGLGLGLYISKKLVEAHGGQLKLYSVPGHGSTFSFTLPRHEAQTAASH